MVSVVLLEVTTEHTVRKPEACSPLRASPSLEYTERKKISRNTAASRLTESHGKNLCMGSETPTSLVFP